MLHITILHKLCAAAQRKVGVELALAKSSATVVHQRQYL
jgi:hypothetical protein